ncbi:MAG: hypothetical protein ACOCRA_01225 [Halobacteria archaeon]
MERRRFVALLSASVCVSGAGCVGSTQTDDGSGVVGRLPAQATTGFGYVDVTDVRAHETLNARDYAQSRLFANTPGIEVSDLDGVVSFGERRATASAVGEFDVSDVSSALESEGFSESTSRRGYRVFESVNGRFLAVDETRCVSSGAGPDAVRRTVDALEGDGVTAVDFDADFAALVDGLGDGGGTFVTGAVVGEGRVVARGKRVEVEAGDATARVTLVHVFDTEQVAANRTASLNTTAKDRIRGPTAENDGRTVTVTGEVDVDRL